MNNAGTGIVLYLLGVAISFAIIVWLENWRSAPGELIRLRVLFLVCTSASGNRNPFIRSE